MACMYGLRISFVRVGGEHRSTVQEDSLDFLVSFVIRCQDFMNNRTYFIYTMSNLYHVYTVSQL